MVTVADFTSDLEQIRCVAGFCGTNREVTSFTIIDTPEILDWLHGGEFVVDSGYITSHNPSMLKGFIASLKEKGCAITTRFPASYLTTETNWIFPYTKCHIIFTFVILLL